MLRGEVVWNGNNSVNLWGRVEQGSILHSCDKRVVEIYELLNKC